MKKQYSKPGIIIEDFKISQHIASCGAPHESQWEVHYQDRQLVVHG